MGGRDPVHLLPRPHCQEAGSKQNSQDSDTTKFIHSFIRSFTWKRERVQGDMCYPRVLCLKSVVFLETFTWINGVWALLHCFPRHISKSWIRSGVAIAWVAGRGFVTILWCPVIYISFSSLRKSLSSLRTLLCFIYTKVFQITKCSTQ